jgi:hypothetical protein
MPYFNKDNAETHQDAGIFREWTSHLDDTTVNYVEIDQDMDLAPLLKGLPDDRCQCPHWGYQFEGTQTVRYGDGREETFNAGDSFYMTPGHTPKASAGSKFIVFSPTEQLAVSEAVMQKNMQAMAAAGTDAH